MRARVGVVGLDDVPEQERGAAVRMAELERMIDPAAPLARKGAQQPGEREHEQECGGMVDRRQRGEQPDRRERRIHAPRHGQVADEEPRRDPERDPGVHRRDREVAGELGDERREEHEHGGVSGCGTARRDEDEDGAE